MGNLYNREIISNNLSMGEYALLHYNDILDKTVFNRIIISTILQLHLKGFIELNRNNDNKLIIKIKDSTTKLKTSEVFIYDCLKSLDIDNNTVVTLDEFNITSTKVFVKNKNRIKKIIIQEALEDNLIDIDKYTKKRTYFFRTLRILLFIILTISIPNSKILLSIFIFLLPILGNNIQTLKSSFTHVSKHSLNNNDIIPNTKIEFKDIFLELLICLCICFLNIHLLMQISLYSNTILVYCAELIISLIFVFISYDKFRKSDGISDKALQFKQNLNGLENFLKDYSLIENKKTIDIHIWEDYLAFSVLLGINETITDELKINLSSVPNTSTRYYDYYENRYRYK